MRVKHYLLFLLSFAIATGATLPAADQGRSNPAPRDSEKSERSTARITFQAILVIASDEGASDSSLDAHVPTLRRVLRFKSYRRAGAGSATMAAGGNAVAALGRGHNLDLSVTSVTDDEIVFGVRWFNRDQTLANTRLTRPRRATTVIGGAATEDGKGHYAVIVTTN